MPSMRTERHNYRTAANDDSVTIVIGWDRAGRLLEVGYRMVAADRIRIIHVMKCRANWI